MKVRAAILSIFVTITLLPTPAGGEEHRLRTDSMDTGNGGGPAYVLAGGNGRASNRAHHAPAGGEERDIQFTHLNTENSGLSYDGVSKIMQDSRGFIWIGTFKGLNRYDGSGFRVYDQDDLGLSSDFVHTIVEDREGNLWVGTDKGVTRYDYARDRFVPLDGPSDKGTVIRNKVTFITLAPDGSVWMLVNDQGFFRYDPADGTLANLSYDGMGQFGFRKLLLCPDGSCWVSRYHVNLFHADPGLANLRPVELDGPWADWFKGDEIEGLFPGPGETVYVASTRHGISAVDPAAKTVRNLFPLPEGQVLQDAFLEGGRRFWLSTTSGVWSYDLETGRSRLLSCHPEDRFSIAGSYVFCTFIDRDGGLWIGTKDGGVSYSGVFQQHFERQYQGLEKVIVSGFAEDGDGRIWVTTEQAGLLAYDPARQETVRCGAALPRTLCSPCYDDGHLWLGSLQGLYRMDVKTGKVKAYGVLQRASGINDPRVYVVRRLESGKIFAGTTLGLFQYDRDSDTFRDIPDFNGVFVTSVGEDASGHLWVSSFAGGVYRWDRASALPPQQVTSGDVLATDKVSSVHVDAKGRVWMVGFSSGFVCYCPQERTSRRFDRKSLPSLPSDVFFSVVEDDEGLLWLASDVGLVQFNPDTEEVKVYTRSDGLLDTKLTNSAFQAADGSLYFGSDNGFTRFSPAALRTEQPLPRVVLTAFRIGGRVAEQEGNIDLVRDINLKARENSFGFDVSVLGARSPSSCHLQWMLEGYDADWKDLSPEHVMFWFNVPSGTYTLRIRASLPSAEWAEARPPLRIRVRPPFWFSPPGLALVLLLFTALLFLALQMAHRRALRKQEQQEEAYRKAKDEEAFQEKMNFFSHVIHEIKTPLTLIRTPLTHVLGKETFDEEARQDLEVMRNSTTYLTRLVQELLDYVRIEKKGYVMHPEPVDLVERLGALIFDYRETARDRNIRLDFAPALAEATVQADVSALDKILNNLLLNAVKYSETFIRVTVDREGDQVAVRFANDGPPIPEGHRADIFKPFFQYARETGTASNGVGIGLPLARTLARHQGGDLVLEDRTEVTCFLLTFPLTASQTPVPDPEPAEPESPYPRLLVVDDNTELREYIASKFTGQYDVVTASSAEAALRILQEQNIDLLLTDISMSGKSGLDLCRDIRSDIEVSHLPIIILSARTSVESKVQAMEAGADLYIEKPFDLEYLKSSIRNILDRRSLMKSAVGSGLGIDIDLFGLPKRDEEFFTKFDSLIRENLSRGDLNNEWLSEQMNMSQSTLVRKVRKMLNTSPNNYIRMTRLSVAARLLKESHGNNISEIAYTCGFSGVSYFAKCFREQYGMTPSEYAARP